MSGPGRPSLYRTEFCALAREHCRQGGSLDQLARRLGVSSRSIDNWVVRFPELAAAVGEGRADAEAETDRILYHRAVGWQETVTRTVIWAGGPKDILLVRHQKPDAAACMRWLCRNLPWQWQRRPRQRSVRAPRRTTSMPAQPLDLLAAAEVVDALHQLSLGYEQSVERIVVGRHHPEVHRTIRRHRPHVRAGKFWLLNRLPDQWKVSTVTPAHKFPLPRPEGPPPEGKLQSVEATSRGWAAPRASCLGTTAVTPAHIFSIPVVSTGARSAEWRDLFSTTSSFSLKEGLSTPPRFRSAPVETTDAICDCPIARRDGHHVLRRSQMSCIGATMETLERSPSCPS